MNTNFFVKVPSDHAFAKCFCCFEGLTLLNITCKNHSLYFLQNDMTDICNEYVKRSKDTLKAITQTMSDTVQNSFSDIGSKLTEGSTIAEQQATVTCTSWGNTVSNEYAKTKNWSIRTQILPLKTKQEIT